MKLSVVCLLSCLILIPSRGEAANRTVCASGCQFTTVQAAIDAAVPGDVILLRAGQTFQEHIVLRAKSATATGYITIRSDAADGSLPGPEQRLIPEGKTGANVSRTQLARLIGRTGTYRATPVIKAELGAHHYRLQFLDIDGVNSEGYYTLIEIGLNSSSQTLANAPHHIVLDRIYAHGHPKAGMQRGLALNGRNVDIINSYFSDFFSVDESQAIGGFNGAGPFRIENNYLEAAAENIMFGGADPRTPNLVPSDIVIRRNHIVKRTSWMNAAIGTPGSVTASATSGGVLASGTHYFKVVARVGSGGYDVVSSPSAEVSATTGSGGAVRLSWGGVATALGYRVYRGTSPGAEKYYMETSGTSLTYTGSGEKSGTPKSSATKWTIKNLIELKNAQRVTIDGNVIENIWQAAQNGYALVFTPRNQEGTAPWSVVRDVTVRNNIVRRAAAGALILGRDYVHASQQTTNIRLENNLFDDINSAYGHTGAFLVITDGPANVRIDHNTIIHTGTAVLADAGAISGFVYTNNFSRHNDFGIFGSGKGMGIAAMPTYFPGGVITGNVLAGGASRNYPAGNFFPATSAFLGSFVNPADLNFELVATSPYNNAATDGKDIGIDRGSVAVASSVRAGSPASSGDGGSDPTPDPDPDPTPDPTSSLPSGWESEDIGAVGVAGSAVTTGGTFVVRGGGADIWDAADAFHFAYRTMSGDGTIVARIITLGGTANWVKAGVMIRGSLSPSSAHASMLMTGTHGPAFQRRKTDGAMSLHTAGGSGSEPRWLKLTRTGNQLSAYVSADGRAWTLVGSDTVTMPSTVLIGLAVNGHTTSSTVEATFDNVSIAQLTGSGSPEDWSSRDIGNVGLAGSTVADGGTVTVKGAGADIWGTADAFHYTYTTMDGDGSIVARVASLAATQSWAKAGVMMRQTLDSGSAHAMMLLSRGSGAAFQRRPVTGGSSSSTSGGAVYAPEWVKLTRSGATVTAALSSDGRSWRVVGTATVSLTGSVYVGLAVSSHWTGTMATAVFDNIAVTP